MDVVQDQRGKRVRGQHPQGEPARVAGQHKSRDEGQGHQAVDHEGVEVRCRVVRPDRLGDVPQGVPGDPERHADHDHQSEDKSTLGGAVHSTSPIERTSNEPRNSTVSVSSLSISIHSQAAPSTA